MPVIKVSGEDLFYEVSRPADARGSLIFIHGAGADHTLWKEQMAGLPPGFAGYALDLPGHNRSGGQPVSEVEKYAEAVAEFIRGLGPDRPVYLAGQSMGSAITLTLALRTEGLIDGLVLISAGAKMKVASALLESLAAGQSSPDFMKMAFSPATGGKLIEEFMAGQAGVPINTFFQDFLACSVFDVSGEVGRINLPTLIVAGQDDRLTPVKLAHFLRDTIPGARLETIQQAGHMPMLEKPREVNDILAAFVAG